MTSQPSRPRLSVVIPAYNEEAYLGALFDTLDVARKRFLELNRGEVEVIVVDNASTDGTARLARERGARVVEEPHRQIAAARNAGARAATGDIVITCDADNRVPDNMLIRIDEVMSAHAVGGGVRILPEEPRWNTALLYGAFDWGARALGLGFGVIFANRESFWRVGGFRQDVYVGEDGFFVWALKALARREGRAFVRLDDVVIRTSLRKVDQFGFLSILWQHLKFVVMPWRIYQRAAAPTWYQVRAATPTQGEKAPSGDSPKRKIQ